MGRETTYLHRVTGTDSHYFAQSLGTSREANDDLQVVCDALNEVEALRELAECFADLVSDMLPEWEDDGKEGNGKACGEINFGEWRRAKELLSRSQSLTQPTKTPKTAS